MSASIPTRMPLTVSQWIARQTETSETASRVGVFTADTLPTERLLARAAITIG